MYIAAGYATALGLSTATGGYHAAPYSETELVSSRRGMPTIGDPGAMWTREGAGMIAAGEVGNKKMSVGGGEMMIKNSRDLLHKARDKG